MVKKDAPHAAIATLLMNGSHSGTRAIHGRARQVAANPYGNVTVKTPIVARNAAPTSAVRSYSRCKATNAAVRMVSSSNPRTASSVGPPCVRHSAHEARGGTISTTPGTPPRSICETKRMSDAQVRLERHPVQSRADGDAVSRDDAVVW